jgi:hypothetical protein
MSLCSNNGNLTEHTSHHEPLHGQFRAGMQQDDGVMGGKDKEDEDEHGQYLFSLRPVAMAPPLASPVAAVAGGGRGGWGTRGRAAAEAGEMGGGGVG